MASSSTTPKTAISGTPSSPGEQTIPSAQPSMANTNLSEMNGTQTTESYDSLASASSAQIRPPISAHVRFMVALVVLISQGLSLLVCQSLLADVSQSNIVYYMAVIFNMFIAYFTLEWIRIHSFALTRQKRAFFDEVNILETYQPRARTHGHLFMPDPPTPGPVVKISDDCNPIERSASEKSAFKATRDAHYDNMFQYALRIAKEAEDADRQALDAQKVRLSQEAKDAKKPDVPQTPSSSDDPAPLAIALPKGEPLYEDFPVTGPLKSPPADVVASSPGTRLELPPSMIEKVDVESIRVGENNKSHDEFKPTVIKGLFFEHRIPGGENTSSTTAATSSSTGEASTSTAATSTSTVTTASTPPTQSSTASTNVKSSGQKRGKKKSKNMLI